MAVKFDTISMRARLRQAVMRGIVKGTEAVKDEAISLVLNGQKTGRVYRRRGVEHQASAPGEPFASNTGRTVNAFETRYDEGDLSGTVLNTAAHFPALEYGTRNMEPRPSLRPALANKRAFAQQAIRDEIAKEFK